VRAAGAEQVLEQERARFDKLRLYGRMPRIKSCPQNHFWWGAARDGSRCPQCRELYIKQLEKRLQENKLLYPRPKPSGMEPAIE
jgi:ssDNA-binding Zn-finger/Zn-ribbon topoisomerase 1